MNLRGILTVSIVGSSLIAFAQSTPRAVLLRLEPTQTIIAGVLEGKTWIDPDKLSSNSQAFIKTGLNTMLLGMNGVLGKATSSGFEAVENDPCDWVRNTSISTALKVPKFPAYAISANWNPVPRVIQRLPLENAAYQKIMAAELKARKINAPVVMSQILKTDLDGDKIDEVILVAQRPKVTFDDQRRLESKYEQAVGDYSLVLVRKVVAGSVKTFVLGERNVTKLFDGTGEGLPTVLTQYVTAIADIDGDGRMEVFVDDYTHEGEGVTIFGLEWQGVQDDARVGLRCVGELAGLRLTAPEDLTDFRWTPGRQKTFHVEGRKDEPGDNGPPYPGFQTAKMKFRNSYPLTVSFQPIVAGRSILKVGKASSFCRKISVS